MVWQGLMAKSMSMTVTGVMGAATYETLRKVWAKAPVKKATVVVTSWGVRAGRTTKRKAQEVVEQAQLRVADVAAEAKERVDRDVSPLTVAGSNGDHDR